MPDISGLGKFAGALRAYEAGLDIAKRLAAQDPKNAEWQRDLVVSHVKLADVAEHQRQPGDAAAHYRTALDVVIALQTNEQLAPKDAWMVGAFEECLRRVTSGSAGE